MREIRILIYRESCTILYLGPIHGTAALIYTVLHSGSIHSTSLRSYTQYFTQILYTVLCLGPVHGTAALIYT